MEHSFVPSPEPEPQPLRHLMPSELLTVAGALTTNAYLYATKLAEQDQPLDGIQAMEFHKKFTDLARTQQPGNIIQGYFQDKDDYAGIFGAIQTNLDQWRRKGIVETQIGPLTEYIEWLLKAHIEEALELFDPETRRDVTRRLDMALARLGINA